MADAFSHGVKSMIRKSAYGARHGGARKRAGCFGSDTHRCNSAVGAMHDPHDDATRPLVATLMSHHVTDVTNERS